MCEPAQQLVTAVVVDDGLAHDRAEPGHARGEPIRYSPTVQLQISGSRSSRHWCISSAPVDQPKSSRTYSDRARFACRKIFARALSDHGPPIRPGADANTERTMTTTAEATPSSDRELVLTRLIDAPRAKVFKAWT